MAYSRLSESFGVRSRSREVMALLRKDLLYGRVNTRLLIGFLLLTSLALLLSSDRVRGGDALSNAQVNLSTTTQVFCLFALITPILVPVLAFMFQIQNEKTYGSFAIYRILPVSCHTLFCGKVLGSITLTVVCVSMLYLSYLTFLSVGLINRDALTPALFGFPFIFFITSLSIFSSVLFVGLAFNISPQMLPPLVTVVSIILVILPLLFSQRVAGFDGQEVIVRFISRYGFLEAVSSFLLLLSIFAGGLGSWAFRLKRSYV